MDVLMHTFNKAYINLLGDVACICPVTRSAIGCVGQVSDSSIAPNLHINNIEYYIPQQ